MPLTYEVHDTTPPLETPIVDNGLGDANRAAAPISDVVPLTCFARDESGTVVGGAIGRSWGECCELQQLWVAAGQRGGGTGSRLVKLFEARGKERGCRTFYLSTFSFQAPAFYKALGYHSAHEIRGFPGGIVKHLMMRHVASDEG